jgi:cell division protein FtsA
LSKQDKDLGVVLIDIGADLTEIVVFLDSQLSYITVLPIGGDNITKAISDNLHITEGVAERLKIEHGSIEEPPKTEKVTAMDGSKKRSISRKELQEILSAEYNKIFNLIKKEFTNFGLTQDTSSGVVICGQPVMMDGCLELAEFIFGLPVRMGHILVLNSSPKPLASHIYAPAVGLLKYGSESKQYKKSIFSINPKNLIATLTDSAYNLYHDYF